jgi:DNA-binding NarL/FixJ family response regulator
MQKSDRRIRIILAGGEPVLREGLRNLLQLEPDLRIAGITSDSLEVIGLVAQTRPDVVIVDLGPQGIPGLGILQTLLAADKNVRVLMLGTADAREEMAEAFRLGARGVVLKEYATKALVLGIRSVVEGRFWVGQEAVANPSKKLRGLGDPSKAGSPPRTFGLTRRELEVVSAIVAGHSNKDIARRFRISEDTVKHHVTNIFDKVGVFNRLELALFAIHHSLIGGR